MKNKKKIKLSVIIPCYNEIKTIDKLIQKVKSAKPLEKEIIVVDDCSTDGTREQLIKYKKQIDNLILRKLNSGKGAALRDGIRVARGQIIIFQDADLEYDPDEHIKVIQPILDGYADVVYGSRFSSGNVRRVMFFWHRIANGILTLLSNMFTNLNLTDMETCFKAFRTDIIKNIKIVENRFGIEPEITAKVSKIKNLKIYEVGISYKGRTYDEGKKIGLKDAFRALYCIIKYNYFYK